MFSKDQVTSTEVQQMNGWKNELRFQCVDRQNLFPKRAEVILVFAVLGMWEAGNQLEPISEILLLHS
jgi:hypothetical protein